MKRFIHGWKADKIDQRDKLYRRISKPRAYLPDYVNLRDKMPPVVDQGALGSCTANALAAAMGFLEIAQMRPFEPLSRLFIYFNEREMEGDVYNDGGAELRDGIKSLNQLGVCDEKEWPYAIDTFTKRPAGPCYVDALENRISSYHRLLSIKEMINCLADGYPFVFGFTVFSGFESEEVAKTGIAGMPQPNEENMGGHAVCCVGYDIPNKRFLIRNSWGEGWGDKGYFSLPFEYMEALADDFWVILK